MTWTEGEHLSIFMGESWQVYSQLVLVLGFLDVDDDQSGDIYSWAEGDMTQQSPVSEFQRSRLLPFQKIFHQSNIKVIYLHGLCFDLPPPNFSDPTSTYHDGSQVTVRGIITGLTAPSLATNQSRDDGHYHTLSLCLTQ